MVDLKPYELGNICTRLSSGKSISSNNITDTGKVPVYGGNGLRGYTENANFEGDCAIIGRQGAFCGNVRFFSGKAYMTEHAVVVCAKPEHNTRFLSYVLGSMNLGRLSGQSAQPGLSVKTLSKQVLMLPSKDIQDKIVSILASIEEKIEANKQINNNLLEQLRTICKSMVIDRDDLELSPISERCIVVTKGTTPTTLGKPFVEQGINFIKAESILDDHSFDRGKFAYIDEETNQLLRRSIIQRDDIVYTIAGTLGRFALVDERVLPANTNQAVAIIRVDREKLSPEYLYSLFIADWQNEYYSKHIQQAVQANLSLTTIKSLPIPILKGKAMQDYVSLITPFISKMKELEHENALLSSTRDSLLPKLMSGELDVAHI